jgi:hypothetical protein
VQDILAQNNEKRCVVMKLKHLFTVNAIISSVFGLSLLLMPTKLFMMYGQQLDTVGATTARMWGSAIFGYALLTWFSRNVADSEARRVVVLSLFLYFTIGFFASVYNQLIVPQPPVAWSTPVIYLLLAIGYAYFHFKKPTEEN